MTQRSEHFGYGYRPAEGRWSERSERKGNLTKMWAERNTDSENEYICFWFLGGALYMTDFKRLDGISLILKLLICDIDDGGKCAMCSENILEDFEHFVHLFYCLFYLLGIFIFRYFGHSIFWFFGILTLRYFCPSVFWPFGIFVFRPFAFRYFCLSVFWLFGILVFGLSVSVFWIRYFGFGILTWTRMEF